MFCFLQDIFRTSCFIFNIKNMPSLISGYQVLSTEVRTRRLVSPTSCMSDEFLLHVHIMPVVPVIPLRAVYRTTVILLVVTRHKTTKFINGYVSSSWTWGLRTVCMCNCHRLRAHTSVVLSKRRQYLYVGKSVWPSIY